MTTVCSHEEVRRAAVWQRNILWLVPQLRGQGVEVNIQSCSLLHTVHAAAFWKEKVEILLEFLQPHRMDFYWQGE